MDQCPKCTFPLSDSAVECPSCGVVIAKYLAQVTRAPRPASAEPPAPEKPRQTRNLHGIGGLLLLFVILQVAGTVFVFAGLSEIWPLTKDQRNQINFLPLLSFMINYEVLFNIVQIIGSVVGMALILSRAPRTAFYWRAFLVLTIIGAGVDFWVASLVPGYTLTLH